jgi:L-alanine-DL-glutamate epimerase-like enolase superfamily enzyme
MQSNTKIERIDVSAYTIPTDFPESDGTFEWDSTTIVLAQIYAANKCGLGFTYGDLSAARLIDRVFSPILLGRDPMAIPAAWSAMGNTVRNIGRRGVASMAMAAVDIALWDLKARLLDVSLRDLLGSVREGIPVYGSGGFTSYSVEQIERQFHDWIESGIRFVKMKIGRNPESDLRRVAAVRKSIGRDVELFVDANGAYSAKQALCFAAQFADLGVTWFEEPVSSDNLDGLRLIRERAPERMDITAGEYGFDTFYFRRMLDAGAVDVIQIDATRCAGISGFLEAAAVASSRQIPLSAHTAPSVHADVCCAVYGSRHVEYFHDHVRIEKMLFDGVLEPAGGLLYPDHSRPGHGLEFKRADAVKYAA